MSVSLLGLSPCEPRTRVSVHLRVVTDARQGLAHTPGPPSESHALRRGRPHLRSTPGLGRRVLYKRPSLWPGELRRVGAGVSRERRRLGQEGSRGWKRFPCAPGTKRNLNAVCVFDRWIMNAIPIPPSRGTRGRSTCVSLATGKCEAPLCTPGRPWARALGPRRPWVWERSSGPQAPAQPGLGG